MMLKISEGLKYLHEQGIVHHDLKPKNILIKDGEPKIADFDAAVFLKPIFSTIKYEDANYDSDFCTLDYLAPEVFPSNKESNKESNKYGK